MTTRSGPRRPRVVSPVSTPARSTSPAMPKARRRRRSARREADAFDHREADERSESTPPLRGRKLELMAQPPPRLPAAPKPEAIPHAPYAGAENRSIAPADHLDRPSSQRDLHASHVELPNVEEPSQRRSGADPSPTEAIVGIRRTNADGTVTDVQTAARGLPAIIAHGHMWTLAIVVAGFVAALIAILMVVRELRPDPAARDTRGCIEHCERSERTCDLIDR